MINMVILILFILFFNTRIHQRIRSLSFTLFHFFLFCCFFLAMYLCFALCFEQKCCCDETNPIIWCKSCLSRILKVADNWPSGMPSEWGGKQMTMINHSKNYRPHRWPCKVSSWPVCGLRSIAFSITISPFKCSMWLYVCGLPSPSLYDFILVHPLCNCSYSSYSTVLSHPSTGPLLPLLNRCNRIWLENSTKNSIKNTKGKFSNWNMLDMPAICSKHTIWRCLWYKRSFR